MLHQVEQDDQADEDAVEQVSSDDTPRCLSPKWDLSGSDSQFAVRPAPDGPGGAIITATVTKRRPGEAMRVLDLKT
ncbi:hypothetical protein ACFVH0_26500 [Streptomyces sp. NPDC127117]|uniref:hypothetical protein n=1 Tax=Streptomyces sp. NPDC127117 TaxID=3345368 RepID=UPI00362E75DC